MQFVSNGPDVPDHLLKLHEEGKVVFFCGAGISRNAGLPDFKGLTEQLYKDVGEPPSTTEQKLIENGQYDLAINLLEGRTTGGRSMVRKQLAKILTPSSKVYEDNEALAVHRALLTLSKDRDEQYKLITTNFDRIFEEIIAKDGLNIYSEVAPHLPLPKKSRWNSIVYLHGLLPEILSDNDLNKLVISSGDFGLAYLIERWASRFVTELFRNYTVCFVGYGINDPVMRYMMDALAADRLLGESSPDMFVFISHKNSVDREVLKNEWLAKGITPLLYQVREDNSHYLLKDTLVSWANITRDGIFGKEQIIVKHAAVKPSESTVEDDFINRVIWALSDTSGLPAKRFSEMDPPPPLDWLDVITDSLLKDSDRKNISLVSNRDDFIYPLTKSTLYIAKWLSRHVGDSRLILWIAKYGGNIHPTFLRELDARLLDKPPSASILKIWQVIKSGRIESTLYNNSIYSWFDKIQNSGVTPLLIMELRKLLKPLVRIKKPFSFLAEHSEEDSIKSYVDWEIVLNSSHISSAIEHGASKIHWEQSLPKLLPEFTNLLHDMLNIMEALDEADEKHDVSDWHQPSIEKHEQNKGFREWAILIELARDAWTETANKNPDFAKLEVQRWQTIRYPLFRRLTFFALANSILFTATETLSWLLEDDRYWLWAPNTKRETMRLLVSLATKINSSDQKQLEEAILAGPSRKMYRDDIGKERFQAILDHEIWLRLMKIEHAGLSLSQEVKGRLDQLSKKYPTWSLEENESDEFTTWMSSGFDSEAQISVPKNYIQLKTWLQREKQSAFERDNWDEFSEKYFLYSSKILTELAKEDIWNISRWNTALHAWSRGFDKKQSIYKHWSKMGEQLLQASDEIIKEVAHGLAYWLQSAAKYSLDKDEDLLFALAKRIIQVYEQEIIDVDTVIDGDQVTKAINHPVGNSMKAVLSWWKRKTLIDNMGLAEPFTSVLSEVCNSTNPILFHGQLIIATDTIALYRVDKDWTRKYLLPLFDWKTSKDTAPGAWKGLLWSPRLYKELLKEIKTAFLDTANHCSVMEDFGKQYANLLTFAAIESEDILDEAELTAATRSLTPECLENAAGTFVDLLSSSTEKQKYWENRLYPYLHTIWPKDASFLSNEVIEKFALLCVNSGDAFPEVFGYVKTWIKASDEDPHYILHKMKENELCKKFPETSLNFLNAIIDSNIGWSQDDLKICLDSIIEIQEELKETTQYNKLFNESLS